MQLWEIVVSLSRRCNNSLGYWSKIHMALIWQSSANYASQELHSLYNLAQHLTRIFFQHLNRWVRHKVTWKSNTEKVARPCREVLSPLSCNTCKTSSLNYCRMKDSPEIKEKKNRLEWTLPFFPFDDNITLTVCIELIWYENLWTRAKWYSYGH